MRYKSIPTEVEAIQWTGSNLEEVKSFCYLASRNLNTERSNGLLIYRHTDLAIWVEASIAWIALIFGTYIIGEPDGKGVYPCLEEVFVTKYSPA